MRNQAHGSLTRTAVRTDRQTRPARHTPTRDTLPRTHTGVQRPRGHMTTHSNPTPNTLIDRHTWEIPRLTHVHQQTKLDTYKSTRTLPHPDAQPPSCPCPAPGVLGTCRNAGTRSVRWPWGWRDQDSSRSLLSSSQCINWGSAAAGLCAQPLALVAQMQAVAPGRTPAFSGS